MNVFELITEINVALATDSELDAWARTIYGSAVTVNPSLDEDNMPAADSCPYVLVTFDTKRVGLEQTEKRHTVVALCEVYDETVAAHTAVANLNVYKGQERLEDFRALVQGVITAAVQASALGIRMIVRAVDIEYLPIEAFPHFAAAMGFEIVEYLALGQDRLG